MIRSAIGTFLKEKVAPFRDISFERLQPLVEGSRVVSFEASEAILHEGEEATHFGVVLERHDPGLRPRRQRHAAVDRPIDRPVTRLMNWR